MSQTLNPKSDFANRMSAAYPSFSKSYRRIADFVLARPLDVVAMSIEGLAQSSGSSTATITRFVRAAGYSGYGEFREKIVTDFQFETSENSKTGTENADNGQQKPFLHTALADSSDNIRDTIANIDAAASEAFIEALINARRIIILGTGASHYAATLLEEGLALYTEKNVTNVLSRGASQYANNFIRSVDEGDVVIAISMPRYSNNTVQLSKAAKQKGAVILAITDSPVSPLVPVADVIFFAPARNRLLPNSPAAIFALADAIVTAVAARRPDIVASTIGSPPEDLFL
ncbi:MurR/RpiR family transcriptional regulator [Pseudochrobactrum sp. sp1633]|uniref:MurR/RpiR family transcriptional regulator n=1 Tax=Pseudochrobactrum sp. sp1633 TaxID=3036706 RepID=UPI0025A544C2|nr:MurR/RpiR family transcriptional regulator [Pseudochrobactrum sp. sp1633]MDM8345398.1 MurR/RpiR family transcriptional regulator [Pseudochrobactrum sp. sp1633]HWD13025.1 MurR/RpiR family transcriptional regulator [Pseudochrobactrum sp.]